MQNWEIADYFIGMLLIGGLFLALRWVSLWYWKIDRIVRNQEQLITLMEKIAGKEEVIEEEAEKEG